MTAYCRPEEEGFSPLAKACASYVHVICDGRSCKGLPECFSCSDAPTCDDYPDTVAAATVVLMNLPKTTEVFDLLMDLPAVGLAGGSRARRAYELVRDALDATENERMARFREADDRP